MDPKIGFSPASLKNIINGHFAGKEPWQIVTVTATSVLTGVWLWTLLVQQDSLYNRSKNYFFRLGRKIPFVKRKIEEELAKIADSFEKDVNNRCEGVPYVVELNEKGMDVKTILQAVDANLGLGHYDWKEGFVSGAVYYYDEKLIDLLTNVYSRASYTNPLHSDVFPGVNKMEAEVVAMAARLFHGSSTACGTMTSGGSESIIMACKAYRDYALDIKGITQPEMILPRTAHPAFDKAAAYFNIYVRHIDVDPITTCVLIKQVKKAINSRTIMIVGSVPNYPYGTMDDIEALASLGRKYNVPVHADCCLGGFLTVFMDRAGYSLPPFDFSVAGVTSISADTHKYGFAPKGSSVVLYSNPEYRRYQYTVTVDWPGGVYGSPSVSGSRAGAIIATCWATMMYFGIEGYVKATKEIIDTAQFIERKLRLIKGIYIFGKPVTSVIAIGSDDFHIYQLSEKLNERGWNLNPLQFPSGIHICITHMHTKPGVAEKFVADVEQIVAELMKNPTKGVEGKMAVYGMSQAIADRSIVGDLTRVFIDFMYYTPKNKAVEQSKPANGVLHAKNGSTHF
ncbi:DegT/DnrJ/EryC1/StrS aminotransferase family [Nesidiocoris tenuis]|uniref:sphinganine-1-phosphate aldolase n=1 Tax=Nesidiocoris tenuis TaxID=355587 RepID=A0ABN7AS85_9HEMI|nr:DegT/DnrJ/EryC1/StrS aminotransferase family [Nesidiocoris tenuis]